MKKICLLYLGKKGSATINALAITRAFLKRNIQVDAFLSSSIENIDKWKCLSTESDNLKCHFSRTYNSNFSFFLGTINICKFITLAKKINNNNYDAIYLPMISLWASILLFFLDKEKVVTTIHDINPHLGQENRIIDSLKEYAAKKSPRIIVHSKRFVPIVKERYRLSDDNVLFTYLGNYLDYTDGFVPEEKIFYKILFFGRITKYKGLSILLQAIQLLNERNIRITLRVVGSGELSEEERKIRNELGNQVELINRWIKDEEIQSFFYGIDFTVLPYIEASQSGVALTSYGFHKPVIVTDVGGLGEQIFDNTGVCIEPNNPDALADAIELMYKRPRDILSMGECAYHMVSEVLTWDKTASDILNFIYRIEE